MIAKRRDQKSLKYALAVDIGGTKVAAAIIDNGGRVHSSFPTVLVPFGPGGVADADALLKIIEQIRGSVDVPLEGIGLSICGNVDEDSGMVPLSPNLHWRYLPFGQMVNERTGLFVAAATDVRMAVLAEAAWGAARGLRYFAWATIGTGYGGYLFLDGKPYRGFHGYAGNFGHATWDEINGAPCGCGKRGCVETFVSGPGIARAGQFAVERGASPVLSALSGEQPMTSKWVFEAAAKGDRVSQKILEEAIRLTSINLAGLVNILDLEMIIIGGGVASAAPDYVERISSRIREFLMTEEAKRDLRVVRESFTNAALYGAAVDVFVRKNTIALDTKTRSTGLS
jgi:glucokinase